MHRHSNSDAIGGKTKTRSLVTGGLGSNRYWFFLVGCSCLWVLFVVAFGGYGDDLMLPGKTKSIDLVETSYTFASPLQASGTSGDCGSSSSNHYTPATREEIRALFDRWNAALETGDPGAVSELYCQGRQERNNDNHGNTEEFLLLLATLSNQPRNHRASVEDYFVGFLKRKPKGRIVSGQIVIGRDGSWAHDSGVYEFSLLESNFGDDNKSGGVLPNTTHHNATATNHSTQGGTESGDDGANNNNNNKAGLEPPEVSIIRARYSFLYLRDDRGNWKIAHHHSSMMPESDRKHLR